MDIGHWVALALGRIGHWVARHSVAWAIGRLGTGSRGHWVARHSVAVSNRVAKFSTKVVVDGKGRGQQLY